METGHRRSPACSRPSIPARSRPRIGSSASRRSARNVPPAPANYAQRSGRAGRGGRRIDREALTLGRAASAGSRRSIRPCDAMKVRQRWVRAPQPPTIRALEHLFRAFAFAAARLAELQDTGEVPVQRHLQPTIRTRRQHDPLDLAADDLGRLGLDRGAAKPPPALPPSAGIPLPDWGAAAPRRLIPQRLLQSCAARLELGEMLLQPRGVDGLASARRSQAHRTPAKYSQRFSSASIAAERVSAAPNNSRVSAQNRSIAKLREYCSNRAP